MRRWARACGFFAGGALFWGFCHILYTAAVTTRAARWKQAGRPLQGTRTSHLSPPSPSPNTATPIVAWRVTSGTRTRIAIASGFAIATDKARQVRFTKRRHVGSGVLYIEEKGVENARNEETRQLKVRLRSKLVNMTAKKNETGIYLDECIGKCRRHSRRDRHIFGRMYRHQPTACQKLNPVKDFDLDLKMKIGV